MNIAIIGAGLSGITLAKELTKFSKITLFEKSKGIGGRLSCRRNKDFFFNHGCPYFEVNSEKFLSFTDELFLQEKLKKLNFNDKKEKIFYKGIPFMNSFLKPLDKEIEIHLNYRVKKIVNSNHKWKILGEDNFFIGNFDCVLTTMPPEQVYDIIPNSIKFKSILKSIYMRSCLTLMVGYEDRCNKLSEKIISIDGTSVEKLTINKIENEKKNLFSIVSYSSDIWAKKNFFRDKKKNMDILLRKTIYLTNIKIENILTCDLQKWKYSSSKNKNDFNFFLDQDFKLGVCGDWCFDGSVDGAYNSSINLSKKIKNFFNLI